MLINVLWVLLAFVIADAFSGIYHLLTDYGYNFPFQVRWFQAHHERPWEMTFDLEPVVGAIPLLILAYFYPAYAIFLCSLAFFVGITQIPHYYCHHQHNANAFIRLLQGVVFLNPKSHENHHKSPYNRDFCILSGWNNWWLNWICKKMGL